MTTRRAAWSSGVVVAAASGTVIFLVALTDVSAIVHAISIGFAVAVGLAYGARRWRGVDPTGAAIAAFFLVVASGLLGGVLLKPAPRLYAYGIERGTPAELASREAGFVELRHARVDLERAATGTVRSTDAKRVTRSETGSIAPIVSVDAAGATERVEFFACAAWLDASDDVSDGTIAGRLAPLDDVDRAAYAKLRNVPLGDHPRCVVRTLGGATFTLVLWTLLLVGYLGAIGAAAAYGARWILRT